MTMDDITDDVMTSLLIIIDITSASRTEALNASAEMIIGRKRYGGAWCHRADDDDAHVAGWCGRHRIPTR
jgi:hypothetical protein